MRDKRADREAHLPESDTLHSGPMKVMHLALGHKSKNPDLEILPIFQCLSIVQRRRQFGEAIANDRKPRKLQESVIVMRCWNRGEKRCESFF